MIPYNVGKVTSHADLERWFNNPGTNVMPQAMPQALPNMILTQGDMMGETMCSSDRNLVL